MIDPKTLDKESLYLLQIRTLHQGKKQERTRIIKLLEDPLHHNIQSPDIHKDCYTCVLIDLIKGEQK